MAPDFSQAILAAQQDLGCKGIGTLHERTLHLALKYYFAPDPTTHEQRIGGFVADAVTEDGVIEVQTRSFSRLKEKINIFLQYCPVTVVYPIANPKWVVWVDEDGVVQSRRKSPKRENLYTAIHEIYALRQWIGGYPLRFALCFVEIEQYRCLNGYGKQKKIRGEHIDRVPLALHDIVMLESPVDYFTLLPNNLPMSFATDEAAKLIECSESDMRMLLNLLAQLGVVEKCGRKGRAYLWQMTKHGFDIMGR